MDDATLRLILVVAALIVMPYLWRWFVSMPLIRDSRPFRRAREWGMSSGFLKRPK